ncbi:MAG: hypothetical protein KF889_19475 [Alphaproteobacteria bacterium]|nr:hypothetical protein [Alphaproteobacteria bacterium]MCW5744042.1 hypothetical protein [Alphaproteobacteria bacterium]
MSGQDNPTHSFRQWAERRLAEIEAALASLETEAGQLEAGLKAEADHAIAGLKRRRDDLRALRDELKSEAADAIAIRRAQLEEALHEVKEVAEAADAQMDKLREAGRRSSAALGEALAHSRQAFDHALRKVREALKSANE